MDDLRFGYEEPTDMIEEEEVVEPTFGQETPALTNTVEEKEGFKMFEVEDPSSDSFFRRLRLTRDAALAKTGNAAEANLAMYNMYDQQKDRYHRAQQYDAAKKEGYTDESFASWVETADPNKLKKHEEEKYELQEFDTVIDGVEYKGQYLVDSKFNPIRKIADAGQEDIYSHVTTNASGQIIGVRKDNGKGVVIDKTMKEDPTKTGKGGKGGSGQTPEQYMGVETSLREVNSLITELEKGDATGVLDNAEATMYAYTGVNLPYSDSERKAELQQRLAKVAKDQLPHVKQFFGPQISNQDVLMMMTFDGLDSNKTEEQNILALKSIRKRLLASQIAYKNNGNKPFTTTAEAQAAMSKAMAELEEAVAANNGAGATTAPTAPADNDPLGIR